MARADFYNENANRAYPFIAGTVAVPGANPLTTAALPNSAIVDAGFVLGVQNDFDAAVHTVYLHHIVRSGDTFSFYFACSAPSLDGIYLVFTRSLSDAPYSVEHSEAVVEQNSESSETSMSQCGDEPVWSGYLVTGDLHELAALIADGQQMISVAGAARIEPALIYNAAASWVSSLNLANDDRTRATNPADCLELIWPFARRDLHINSTCLLGDIRLAAGHNIILRQDNDSGTIYIGASYGAGSGAPGNSQIPLFAGEQPPVGRYTLDGALRCNDVIRSINGIGGRHFEIKAGPGVTVTADHANHRIVLAFDMKQLAVCYDEQS